MKRCEYVDCTACGEIKNGGVAIYLTKPIERGSSYAPIREIALCDDCIRMLKEV